LNIIQKSFVPLVVKKSQSFYFDHSFVSNDKNRKKVQKNLIEKEDPQKRPIQNNKKNQKGKITPKKKGKNKKKKKKYERK
jgi:hypothetical protein